MSDLPLLSAVEPVMFGVVKLCWQDGYEGIVDLRPILAEGEMFAFLRSEPARFASVQLGELGHAIHWLDEAGDEIGFSSNALRDKAERQAEIVRLAS